MKYKYFFLLIQCLLYNFNCLRFKTRASRLQPHGDAHRFVGEDQQVAIRNVPGKANSPATFIQGRRTVIYGSPRATPSYSRAAGSFGRILRHGSRSTPQKASPKMPPDILEVPSVRSTKTIDTSSIRNPSFHAVYFIST